MGKFKVHSSNNFTIINNSVFYNRNISWKAKGILAQMLSLPETWDYTEAGLTCLSTDGITSTRTALKELEKAGYLVRSFIRDEQGKIADIDYDIYEIPVQDNESPFLENPITDSTNVRSSVVTDSPTMRSPDITGNPTMRSSVNGFSKNAENKPFTGHPFLGSPLTDFPFSENKHNKELNIIKNQSNKEPTTGPDTDGRIVGSPENGYSRQVDAGSDCERSVSADGSDGSVLLGGSDMSGFQDRNMTGGTLSDMDTSDTDSANLSDSNVEMIRPEVEFQQVEDILDDAVTNMTNTKLYDDVTSSGLLNCDKENHHLNECDKSGLNGCDQLVVRDISTRKRMDTPVSNTRTLNLVSNGDKSESSDDISGQSEVMSNQAVTDFMTANGQFKATSINSVYDNNENHDLSEGMEFNSKEAICHNVRDVLTKNQFELSLHENKEGDHTRSSLIDKEKKELTGSVSDHLISQHVNVGESQLSDVHEPNCEIDSDVVSVSNQLTHQNEMSANQSSKINCENQVISDEQYSRRENEHRTALWNTYEIDGYFFAEPISNRNVSQSASKRVSNNKASFGRSDQSVTKPQTIRQENMVMPAKQEIKTYASFEELYNDAKDLLKFPGVSDVLDVIRTIINSNEPYVQVRNSSIPKDEFVAMLLSTPKKEILETAHTVIENMYGIRNRFSYIKTLLYIAAIKRSGSYLNQTSFGNQNRTEVDNYTNTYRNSYRHGNKFNDFEQRNYDYELLERQLLSR